MINTFIYIIICKGRRCILTIFGLAFIHLSLFGQCSTNDPVAFFNWSTIPGNGNEWLDTNQNVSFPKLGQVESIKYYVFGGASPSKNFSL